MVRALLRVHNFGSGVSLEDGTALGCTRGHLGSDGSDGDQTAG